MSPLQGKPLLTSVVFVSVGVMPLYLTSAQVVSLDSALGFDAGRLGLATALYFGLAAALAQPVAATVTRVGAQTGMRAGALLSLFGSGAAATAGRWWAFPIAVALAGLANAFMQVSTNVALATGAAFHRQGVSFGAKQGAIPLAGAFAGALLPSVGVAVGWRWPYVFAMALAVVILFIAPEVEDRPLHTTRVPSRERPPLSRSLKFLALGGACGGAAGNGLSLFLVLASVDIGTTEAVAGTVLAVGSALVFLLRVGVGAFADRFESTGQREMAVLLLLGAVASFALSSVTSVEAFIVVMPLALMGSWGWPGLIYFTVVRIHPEATARASGVILASNLTGTLVGPSVVAQFADRGQFASAWVFVGALSLSAAIFMTASWYAMPKSAATELPGVELERH